MLYSIMRDSWYCIYCNEHKWWTFVIEQFNDAFQSVTARREIKKKLRSILWIKYQIKDNDVFEKAYSYIEMYY